jgi:hypothetical protein
MKITKAKLKQIIKEELSSMSEGRRRGGGYSIANARIQRPIRSAASRDAVARTNSTFDQETASSMLYHIEKLRDVYHDIEDERELTPEEAEELKNLEDQYARIMNAGLDDGYGAQ